MMEADFPGNFFNLLSTNAAPSLVEKKIFSRIIADIDSEVSYLDERITSLQNQLEEYKTKRVVCMTRRLIYTKVISPLRCIPPEILSKIFVYASAQSTSFRWTASYVCRLWRHVALDTSELWSAIRVQQPPASSAWANSLKDRIRTCVQRARSRPLTLIYNDTNIYDDRTRHLDVLSDITAATTGCKWKEIWWITRKPDTYFENELQLLGPESYDVLESLTLDNYPHSFTMDPPHVQESGPGQITLKPNFSRLSKFSISLHYPIQYNMVCVPWWQLIDLHLRLPSADCQVMFNILRQCSILEVCSINLLHGFDSTSIGVEPINLSKLRKLQLMSYAQEIEAIVKPLVTPLIHDLDINVKDDLFTLKESDFRSYLIACGPTLRRLWLTGVGASDVQNVIIPNLPFLEELAMVCLDSVGEGALRSLIPVMQPWPSLPIDDDALDLGTEKQRQDEHLTIPLPRLCILKIVCEAHASLHLAFIDIVKSRWWTDDDDTPRKLSRLCYVSLQHADLLQEVPRESRPVYSELKELERQGLNMDIFSLWPDVFDEDFYLDIKCA